MKLHKRNLIRQDLNQKKSTFITKTLYLVQTEYNSVFKKGKENIDVFFFSSSKLEDNFPSRK